MDTEAEADEMHRVTDVAEEDDPELQAFADEKDVTLLAFVGTYAHLAAAKHDRRFLGIDKLDKAIDCVQTRLAGYKFRLR